MATGGEPRAGAGHVRAAPPPSPPAPRAAAPLRRPSPRRRWRFAGAGPERDGRCAYPVAARRPPRAPPRTPPRGPGRPAPLPGARLPPTRCAALWGQERRPQRLSQPGPRAPSLPGGRRAPRSRRLPLLPPSCLLGPWPLPHRAAKRTQRNRVSGLFTKIVVFKLPAV